MTTSTTTTTIPHSSTAPSADPSTGAVTVARISVADGVALPVATRGVRRAGVPSIVFIHGITDSWRSFEEVIELLPSELHVIAPTLRGHCGADHPATGYSPDELAADVAVVLDRLGVDSALVVGHSLGTMVGSRLAAARPDLVAGLLLEGGVAAPAQNPAAHEMIAVVAELTDPIAREVAAEFQYSTTVQPVPAERMEVYIGESMAVPAHVWQAAFGALLDVDVLAGLDGSTIPTLLVWGTEDVIGTWEDQEQFAATFADTTINRYEGTGHAVHWEQPARFADDVVAWWKHCTA